MRLRKTAASNIEQLAAPPQSCLLKSTRTSRTRVIVLLGEWQGRCHPWGTSCLPGPMTRHCNDLGILGVCEIPLETLAATTDRRSLSPDPIKANLPIVFLRGRTIIADTIDALRQSDPRRRATSASKHLGVPPNLARHYGIRPTFKMACKAGLSSTPAPRSHCRYKHPQFRLRRDQESSKSFHEPQPTKYPSRTMP